jgi:hypothetical protein
MKKMLCEAIESNEPKELKITINSKSYKIRHKLSNWMIVIYCMLAALAIPTIAYRFYTGDYFGGVVSLWFGLVMAGIVYDDREGRLIKLHVVEENSQLFKINDVEYFSGTPEEFYLYLELNDIPNMSSDWNFPERIVHTFK